MKTAVLLAVVAMAAAMPREEFEPQTTGELTEGGWQSWDALRNWLRPATTYISESLPDMTPSELASDVRDAAVDLRDRAKDHPVVQGVASAVRPVHQWISDKASTLSKTSFRDMYDSAMNSVRRADEHVADWLNSESQQQQSSQKYSIPQAEDIEILH